MPPATLRIPATLLLALFALAGRPASAQEASGLLPRPTIAGRVLWLRADRGTEVLLGNIVPRWSGYAAPSPELTQTLGSSMPLRESYGANGRAALHFDGDDWLESDRGMPTGSYTKIVVVRLDDYAASNHVLSGETGHALCFDHTDTAQLHHHSVPFVTSSMPTPLGEPTILVATFDASTGAGHLYQNGALVGSGSAAPNDDRSIQLGAFAGGGHLRGGIPEVLLYDRVLTTFERRSIEALLEWRYRSVVAPRVDFTRLPRHAQVFQRDVLGQARLVVEGSVETPGYDSIELRVLRDGASWSNQSLALQYNGNSAGFDFNVNVLAGLFDYQLLVTLVAGSERVAIREVDSIACGDTFLINGQSNAIAGDFFDEGLANQSQSYWIRSFGSSVDDGTLVHDHNWGLADGGGRYYHCTVGTWGLRAAELILQEAQVPIGLLNGAVGGTAIVYHLRNDANPTDVDTLYGRLLYRARQAEIDTKARALMWYQGETDREEIDAYEQDFGTLYDSWRQDYPALEKLYVFQIRKGCGVYRSGVREIHRTAPDLYADVEVMSTTAAPGHDGCHFHYAGYRELGDRIARLLARDLYGSTDTQEIDPPNIASAQFVGPGQDSILLTFRDPDDVLVWEAGSEEFFLLDDSVTVVSGSVAGSTILLLLSGPTAATTITYDGHWGAGPWVRNARGVGALTFFGFPITP